MIILDMRRVFGVLSYTIKARNAQTRAPTSDMRACRACPHIWLYYEKYFAKVFSWFK